MFRATVQSPYKSSIIYTQIPSLTVVIPVFGFQRGEGRQGVPKTLLSKSYRNLVASNRVGC